MDGVERDFQTREHFSDGRGVPYLVPYRVTWVPVAQKLLVFTSDANGGNGLLLDGESFENGATIQTEDFVKRCSTDCSGRFVVTVSGRDNVHIWDTKAAKEIFECGQNKVPAVDAPFISNAMFDGDRVLIYTVDNSWGTGTVVVQDVLANQEKARFNSRNGHVVMDVDFAHKRVALTGTERRLSVLDFSGNLFADKGSVTFQRNAAISFSPDGNLLAVGSWDNTIRIFEIKERVEPQPASCDRQTPDRGWRTKCRAGSAIGLRASD